MADADHRHEIADASFALFVEKLGNGFDVILRGLIAVSGAGGAETVGLVG